jgi:hypothetical protein
VVVFCASVCMRVRVRVSVSASRCLLTCECKCACGMNVGGWLETGSAHSVCNWHTPTLTPPRTFKLLGYNTRRGLVPRLWLGTTQALSAFSPRVAGCSSPRCALSFTAAHVVCGGGLGGVWDCVPFVQTAVFTKCNQILTQHHQSRFTPR